jgi:large subunit ribosomal protein L1
MGKIRTQILGLADIDKKPRKSEEETAVKTEKEAKAQAKEEKAVEAKANEEKTAKANVSKKVRGKKYISAKKKIGDVKKTKLAEAVELLKKAKYVAFDESVDLHMNVEKTGLRGEAELPHSTGKTVRVAIVNDQVLEALAAGKIEFDVLITHPSFMSKIARFAKILGPKGLMPNPKAGTVSANPEEVAKKFMKGTLRWKTEPKFPLIHQQIGKLSYDSKNLVENAQAFINAVGKAQIKRMFIASSMGPSIEIEMEKEV